MQTHADFVARERKKVAEYIGIPMPGHFMPESYASIFQEPGALMVVTGFVGPNLVRIEVEIPGRKAEAHEYSYRTIVRAIAAMEEAASNGPS